MRHIISKSSVLLLALWLCLPAAADDRYYGHDDEDNISLPYQDLILGNGNSYRLSLGSDWRHVRQVKIEAEGSCHEGGRLSVYANGSYKGQIRTECGRRNYTIGINEVVRHIDVYHTGGPAVTIKSVCATSAHRRIPETVQEVYPHYPVAVMPARDAGTWIAGRAAKLVDQMRDYVDPETEYVPYLIPIKTAAGRAYASAKANGDLSEGTRVQLKNLLRQIDFAEPLIELLLKKEATFGMAVELQTLRDEIARRLL